MQIIHYRGGGRSSGRETIGRVAGGAVAMKLLEQLGISITAYASSIGPVTANTFCPEEIDNNPFHLPDAEAAAMTQEYVDRMMEEKESSGGNRMPHHRCSSWPRRSCI